MRNIKKPELMLLVANANKVAIIGYPGAGKTTLANEIANEITGKPVIHTDDYLIHSHDDRPGVIMKDLGETFVIEGNEATRLVKRGMQFDLVILVTGSTRNDKAIRGLQGRVDKFVREYVGQIYTLDPRQE